MRIASAGPGDHRDRQPEQDLLRGDQERAPQQAAVIDERTRDLVRGGEHRAVDAPAVDVQLPGSEQHGEHQHRGEHPPHAGIPSASSACSRSAMSSGSVRRRGRASSTSSSAITRPGPGGEHHDPVGEHHRLLDVVGDEHHGARLVGQHPGQPALHLGARDRVEGGEWLIERQHRLTGQQRAQQRHALTHPARELLRARRLEPGQPEALEPWSDLGPGLRPRAAGHP